MARSLALCLSMVALTAACSGENPGADEAPMPSSDESTALSAPTGAKVQLVKEQEIGQAGVKYLDPEFHQGTFQVAFYRGTTDLTLGQIDATTGRFVNHDYLALGKATSIAKTFNGPEFGESQSGTGIYYTGLDSNGRSHNFRYRNGQTQQLDAGDFSMVANYPSKNAADPAALVMGALNQQPIGRRWAVLSEDRPDLLKTFDMAVIGKGPRFVPGRRQITTNVLDSSGLTQLAIHDIDLGLTSQVTFDADNKDSGVMFKAPELGDEMLLFGLVNSGTGIRVYRQVNAVWQPYRNLVAPQGSGYVNPQVLRYRGKTFFTANTKADSQGSSDVLLLSLNGTLSLKVSGAPVMRRFDPETLVSGDHLFIYYYDLQSGRLFLSDLVAPAL